MEPKIIYTYTDEAPMLATHSFLPVMQAFGKAAGVISETWDISLAGRILAAFPDYLKENQRITDALAELGELVKKPEANIIKLPNISASIPQIQAAVKELQGKGYALPDFPEDPKTDEDKAVRIRFDAIKGSAVNPVLREGNSDRRAAPAVKAYAKKNPHSMGTWSPRSKTHLASMEKGDFFESEKSIIIDKPTEFRIEFVSADGAIRELRGAFPLKAGEILDSAVMSRRALRDFLEKEMDDAKSQGVLFSVHLKATMMKVSDPVIFGHAVSVYFRDVFEKNDAVLKRLGVDPDHGMNDLEAKLTSLDSPDKEKIMADIAAVYASRPDLAMVNSDKGITNLHVPSDIIIDASMPAAIRIGGKMWGPDGKEQDMKAVIPDRSYAGVYQAAIEFCKENGAFDPATMGSVSNVGLMAQKAEEYGSHDKTFVSPGDGVIRAVDAKGNVLLEQTVEEGDLFRMCQTRDEAVRDWVKLAVKRAQATGNPAVFWLDEMRSHDARILEKVETYLADHDTNGLEIDVMKPEDACRHAMMRARNGEDTISVTGNVLRDYLTDLFPILELGTSAKMLSIVPLMAGGGLFETGAGGSAPKHIQQLLAENHLRWDSLGEFLALAVSYEHLADTFGNKGARLLGMTLDQAIGDLLDNRKSPSRKCGELDNRGSHFYLAMYWAQTLAKQNEDPILKERFSQPAAELAAAEKQIIEELNSVQGSPADIGGYYRPDKVKADAVMRPSKTFNRIVEGI
jgi:isocitrate dehydrogenase